MTALILKTIASFHARNNRWPTATQICWDISVETHFGRDSKIKGELKRLRAAGRVELSKSGAKFVYKLVGEALRPANGGEK